jgi:hypothetical protein
MSLPYTVKKGDTLSSIARTNSMRSWQELYYHPDNAPFRLRRPNPNLIYPGDVVMIPTGGTPVNFTYTIPGLVAVIRQPTSLVCWATAYTIIRSWKDQASYGIRDGVARVAEKYGVMVDKNQGLPPSEFAPFLSAAGMQREPMANLTIQGWLNLLKRYGPLWVGTLGVVSPGTYLHSRIVEGMRGNGDADGTWMKIVDPESGSRYEELFRVFLARYEGAFILSQGSGAGLREYYHIRHF